MRHPSGTAGKTAPAFLLLALAAASGLPLAAESPPGPPGPSAPNAGGIRVVTDDNYPPYSFRDGEGFLQGILVDLWAAWSEATGTPVELTGMDWGFAQKYILAGHAEVIDTMFETPERRLLYSFSKPYARIAVPLFFHASVSGIARPADLRGFRVGAKAGDAAIGVLREAGVRDIVEYPNYESIVRAAVEGDLKVFTVDEPPALYFLAKLGADRDFRRGFEFGSGEFHRAVRRGSEELLARVEAGFASIPAAELEAIDRRWLGSGLGKRFDARILYAGLALLAAAFLNALVIAIVLRRRVASRTAELREKVLELGRSEARNRAFIAALPDLYFRMDATGRYLECSGGRPELLALPAGILVGHTMRELGFPPEAVDATETAIARALATDEVQVYEYWLDVPAGRLSFEGRVVRLEADSVILIARDVTGRKLSEERIQASLEEKEVLLREIHHRVKNNMQVVSSLLSLQAESFRDPYDRLLFSESQQRIRAMAQLHELLYRSENLASIRAADYLDAILSEVAEGFLDRPGRVAVETRIEEIELGLDTGVPLGLIVNELASNVFKYAFPGEREGRLFLSFERAGEGRLRLVVADDGVGLPPGLDPRRQDTMGFTLVSSLARQLGGTLEVDGSAGTRVELVF